MAAIIRLTDTAVTDKGMRLSPMTSTHEGHTVLEFNGSADVTYRLVLSDVEAINLIATLSRSVSGHLS